MSGFNQPPAEDPADAAQPDSVRDDSPAGVAAAYKASQQKVDVTDEQLAAMTPDELTELGGHIDGVQVIAREYEFEPGSKGEKRQERRVAVCFALAALLGLAFVAVYLFWPWRVNDVHPTESSAALWYTPLLGFTLGGALVLLGIGMVIWAKRLMPHEIAIQERHEGASPEIERQATAATLVTGAQGFGLDRRKLLRRSLLGAGGVLGLAAIIPLGGLINNPYNDRALFHTAWQKGTRLLRANGTPVRPGDMEPGSLETVYPYAEGFAHQGDTPTMLIRLHLDQAAQFKARPMNELEEWGGPARWNEYVAYSKICTHLGCPVSLYERETGRILCPCHQSQFQIVEDAKPVFGPATRSLPALPIEVDEEGYFIARSDFREPVGPAFWDRQRGVTKNAE